jgi:hypothetical protein
LSAGLCVLVSAIGEISHVWFEYIARGGGFTTRAAVEISRLARGARRGHDPGGA